MVVWRFPGEWKVGEETKLRFDYSAFDRFVETMLRAGIDKSIFCFTLVGGDIGYVDTTTGTLRVHHTTPNEEAYQKAWAAFLPPFVQHLQNQGWFDRTYMAFDEAPVEVVRATRAMLKSYAPGLKIALEGGGASRELTDSDHLLV